MSGLDEQMRSFTLNQMAYEENSRHFFIADCRRMEHLCIDPHRNDAVGTHAIEALTVVGNQLTMATRISEWRTMQSAYLRIIIDTSSRLPLVPSIDRIVCVERRMTLGR